jgi:DNA-binding MarR family transcriptional regulator
MFGSVTGRAEAQVVRLSLIYALLDRSGVIRLQHMLAALAVWDYCEASARFVFADSLGDPDADRILAELRRVPEGLTRTEIRDLFQRHRSEVVISNALARLEEYGLARRHRSPTEGRPEELWIACEGATKAT